MVCTPSPGQAKLYRQLEPGPIHPRMAFADWLLPLLLLTADDEHGRLPFDWSAPALPRETISPPPLDPAPAV
jgi:hypothetical protein